MSCGIAQNKLINYKKIPRNFKKAMQLLSYFLGHWLLVPETANPETAMLWGSQATQRGKDMEAPVSHPHFPAILVQAPDMSQ